MNTPTRSEIIASLLEPEPLKPIVLSENEFTLEIFMKESGLPMRKAERRIRTLTDAKRISRVRIVPHGRRRIAVYRVSPPTHGTIP